MRKLDLPDFYLESPAFILLGIVSSNNSITICIDRYLYIINFAIPLHNNTFVGGVVDEVLDYTIEKHYNNEIEVYVMRIKRSCENL